MIDFCKELAKFDFTADDPEFVQYYHETAPLMEALTAMFKRVGRELNQANLQIEEILSLYAEQREAEKLLDEMKKLADAQAAAHAEEKHLLFEALAAVLDHIEDLYRYAVQNQNDRWSDQIKLLWGKTAADLLACGISRIDGEGAPFDARIHAAVQMVEERARPDGVILEVLRSGYIYRSRPLRKAQVIVNQLLAANNTDGGHANYEQHCGN